MPDANKHTPGPWTVYDSFIVTAQSDGSIGINAKIICERGFHRDEDMLLAAAAPDLLEALREIVAINDEPHGVFRKRGGTRRGLSLVTAKAAIAKAEGMS